MDIKSFVLLDEKEMLDLICKEHKLNRDKASMNINYVECEFNQVGSWTIQVQAPQKRETKYYHGPDQLQTKEFNPQR